MAGRPIKTRLDYFPLDVDYFSDRKFKRIRAEFGFTGEGVALRILNEIYKHGYYLEYDEDLAVDIADGTGIRPEVVESVIEALAGCGFLDADMFYGENILTSKGIQRRWLVACEKRKKPELVHWLLDESGEDDGENEYDDVINGIYSSANDAKEKKGKEKKYEDEGECARIRESKDEFWRCVEEYKRQFGEIRREEELCLIEMAEAYGEDEVKLCIRETAVHGVKHVIPYMYKMLARRELRHKEEMRKIEENIKNGEENIYRGIIL